MTLGIEIISDMSKEQLIDEILAHQRKTLEGLSMSELKSNVVQFRVNNYRDRLADEAGLVPTIMGLFHPKEDE